MHIAIDATYGPVDIEPSRYSTGSRRTYVGVRFNDAEAVISRMANFWVTGMVEPRGS